MMQQKMNFSNSRGNYTQRMKDNGYQYCKVCGCWYLDECEWCKQVAEKKAILDSWIETALDALSLVAGPATPERRKELIQEYAVLYHKYLIAVEKNDNLENSEGMNLANEWNDAVQLQLKVV